MIYIPYKFFKWVFKSSKPTQKNNNNEEYYRKKRAEKAEILKTKEEEYTDFRNQKGLNKVITFEASGGFKEYQKQIYLKELYKFSKLKLVKEPMNMYDENAILIMYEDVEMGYVPKSKTKKIHPLIDSGFDTVFIADIRDWYGTNDYRVYVDFSLPYKDLK